MRVYYKALKNLLGQITNDKLQITIKLQIINEQNRGILASRHNFKTIWSSINK